MIELDHTIVATTDKDRAARFLADVLGLRVGAPVGPFAPVRVNDRLTLDFDDRQPPADRGHWAFAVDPATFERALARLRRGDAPFGSGPANGWDRAVGDLDGRQNVYVEDPDGHVYELLAPAP